MKSKEQQNVIDPTHNEDARRSQLLQAWLAAKAAEQTANSRRVAIEGELIELIETKPEGSTTVEIDGYKVTVTTKMTRSMDAKGFAFIREQFPTNLQPIKVKDLLDDAGVKYLQNNEPDLYNAMAPFLTVKPAKPSFTVKAPLVPTLTEVA